jgi:hypothetical protein
LAADVARYSSAITIDLPAPPDTLDTVPAKGDRLRLSGVTGSAEVTVRGYAPASGVVTLERVVTDAFPAGAYVYTLTAVAEIDISDTDDFPAGSVLTLVWAPEGTGAPFTEEIQIERFRQEDPEKFRSYLSAVSPRVYRGVTVPADRFDDVYGAAKEMVSTDLALVGCDIARVRDAAVLRAPLRYALALIWSEDCDDDLKAEILNWTAGYQRAISSLKRLPIWVDNDDNLVRGDEETTDHDELWERSW